MFRNGVRGRHDCRNVSGLRRYGSRPLAAAVALRRHSDDVRVYEMRRHRKIIHQPCKTCKGAGSVKKQKKITVTIPAGIDGGQNHFPCAGRETPE